MAQINIVFTIQILVFAIIVYLFLSAWGEFIQRSIFKAFSLDSDAASSYLIIGVGALALLIVLVLLYGIEAHDLLGISEVVDRAMTSQRERFSNGELINYRVEKVT